LWSLGTNINHAETLSSSDRSIYSISVASFDPDAVLQAQMWNTLVRNKNGVILTVQDEVEVRPEEFMHTSLINAEDLS
jgi:hypothetical protein